MGNRAKNFEYSYLYLKPSHVTGENFKMHDSWTKNEI